MKKYGWAKSRDIHPTEKNCNFFVPVLASMTCNILAGGRNFAGTIFRCKERESKEDYDDE